MTPRLASAEVSRSIGVALLVGLLGCGSDGAAPPPAAQISPSGAALASEAPWADSLAADISDATHASAGSATPRERMTRTTGPDGAVVLSYRDLDRAPVDTLVPDLRIGRANGAESESFGRVRDIEVGPDGTIYVLDYSVPTIRMFATDGRYLRSMGRRGEGPGEFRSPMGIALAPDGALWVQEGQQGANWVVVLANDGRPVARQSPFPRGALTEGGSVGSWDAIFASDGRIWQTATRYQAPLPSSSAMGVIGYRIRSFAQSFDPRSRSLDSVEVSEDPLRRYRYQHPSARGGMATTFGIVPFDPIRLVAIDRAGNAWTALSTAYRLERRTGSATTLTVEAAVQLAAPSAIDREHWESLVSAGLDLEVPQKDHVLERIFADDENRLWVQRKTRPGELNRFDVFGQDGAYLRSVSLPGTIAMTPVVRGGKFYTTLLGDLRVPVVVRAPLPASLKPPR